jgi:hypothetical protein
MQWNDVTSLLLELRLDDQRSLRLEREDLQHQHRSLRVFGRHCVRYLQPVVELRGRRGSSVVGHD